MTLNSDESDFMPEKHIMRRRSFAKEGRKDKNGRKGKSATATVCFEEKNTTKLIQTKVDLSTATEQEVHDIETILSIRESVHLGLDQKEIGELVSLGAGITNSDQKRVEVLQFLRSCGTNAEQKAVEKNFETVTEKHVAAHYVRVALIVLRLKRRMGEELPTAAVFASYLFYHVKGFKCSRWELDQAGNILAHIIRAQKVDHKNGRPLTLIERGLLQMEKM